MVLCLNQRWCKVTKRWIAWLCDRTKDWHCWWHPVVPWCHGTTSILRKIIDGKRPVMMSVVCIEQSEMTFKVTTTKLNFGDAYRYLFSGWISWENSTGANACLFWLISHSLALILDERLATFFLRWSNIVFITTRIKEGFGVLDEQNAIMQSLLSRWCGCEVPNEVAESRIP